MKLYHFTTHDSYTSIERDGFIRPSSDGRYGPGVYLTDLDPHIIAVDEIAKLLYYGGAQKNLSAGKFDYHFYMEIPDDHVKCERPNVYRYISGDNLVVSNYQTVSHGWNDKFLVVGGGLVVAAAATSAATALYNHATDGRQERTYRLQINLQTYLHTIGKEEKFTPVTSSDGGSVQMFCSECNCPVSDVYEGGYLYSSTIDKNELEKKLFDHERMHFW
eukprot:CAMPEP_0181140906 /NCGR_PEP_ID=MMETSP1071-20121207/35547_1 /TAXON_ID=35127 /ORGANISM="Thalassiosira sp., Strain NH16" /LENGTH=217 /DNA_ID=CAMNT_0023227875 /DNA_START=21 /DNA_END=671 /DNA_ORIENTATION=-